MNININTETKTLTLLEDCSVDELVVFLSAYTGWIIKVKVEEKKSCNNDKEAQAFRDFINKSLTNPYKTGNPRNPYQVTF